MSTKEPHILGPFIGYVTDSTATIWLHITDLEPEESRSVAITLHESAFDAAIIQASEIHFPTIA